MITKFNKEEQKRTKFNGSTSSTSVASPEINIVSDFLPFEEALASGEPVASASTPILNRAMVERAVITFFDNGETAKQRYKIAIRLNLKDEDTKTSPEFIAPLTKDGRTFRRYTAPGTRDDLIDFHNEMRVYVKQLGVDNKPYFGKFHLNQNNWGNGISKIQVEPNSYASVWYDGEGWSGVLKIYDFVLPFDLFNTNITEKQTKMGVKSTYLWQNPKYEKTQRPLTWAQKRKTQ
jgi:hypothetical protein